jgi:hypothetical protein
LAFYFHILTTMHGQNHFRLLIRIHFVQWWLIQSVHFIASLSTADVVGAVSNRKPASAGISSEVQGRLPYFIDESQRALIRANAGFLWDKAFALCYTMAEKRSSTTLGMQCESSFGLFQKPVIVKLLPVQKTVSLVEQYKELRIIWLTCRLPSDSHACWTLTHTIQNMKGTLVIYGRFQGNTAFTPHDHHFQQDVNCIRSVQ